MSSMTPVGLTARWMAANRALESELDEPLYRDPFARALAGDVGYDMISKSLAARNETFTGKPEPYMTIRTRFYDDALMEAATRGIRQVVILAAGMDARAFRLAWPEDTVVFEIDRNDIFDYKELILGEVGAVQSCDRHIVGADLEFEWADRLRAAGFDPDEPSAFLVEGLVVYLPAEAVERLMATVGRLASLGSWIGVDFPSPELLNFPMMKPYLELFANMGCPWLTSIGNPEEFLSQHGWTPDYAMPGEPNANFGRWPYPVAPRGMTWVPRSYLASAWRM